MKILMVSSYLPFPLTSGGHIRLYNLIKHLSTKHQITLICEKRNSQTKEDIQMVEQVCEKVITVERKRQWSIDNILKTGISMNPFLIIGHKSEEMKLTIADELIRSPYDLIHVETFYVFQNLPSNLKIPVVLVEHNIEYLVYERFAKLATALVRPLLYVDIAKLKAAEKKTWTLADKLVAVSSSEKRQMKLPDIEVVPNGVDTKQYVFRSFDQTPKEKRVLFIGDYKWMQNKDAAIFIIEQVWPELLDKFTTENKDVDLKLWIVGKNMPNSFKKYQSENIIIDINNKEETKEIFAKSFILLAPLRAAGGSSYKILEAMATGTGVVTTNLGAEGLEAKNGVHAITADTAEHLADAVYKLNKDHSLYKKITINARKFVETNYDWSIIAKKLNEVYDSCI